MVRDEHAERCLRAEMVRDTLKPSLSRGLKPFFGHSEYWETPPPSNCRGFCVFWGVEVNHKLGPNKPKLGLSIPLIWPNL